MDALLSQSGFMFLLRWLHFFFGIMWIGHLYYFNFTQGSFMAEADAATKSGVTTKLLPRALWWFRWGAMWTMVTGVAYLGMIAHGFENFFSTGYGIAITTGALLGLTMWANVWFIIWPKQKIVIASATQVAGGGAALPEAATAAPGALLASRTNTLLSIPMLFFMGAASHFAPAVSESSNINAYYGAFFVLWLVVQGNAMKGQLGPMKTVKGVITSGFVLTAIIFILLSALV